MFGGNYSILTVWIQTRTVDFRLTGIQCGLTLFLIWLEQPFESVFLKMHLYSY